MLHVLEVAIIALLAPLCPNALAVAFAQADVLCL